MILPPAQDHEHIVALLENNNAKPCSMTRSQHADTDRNR
jgi:hypothetical protein